MDNARTFIAIFNSEQITAISLEIRPLAALYLPHPHIYFLTDTYRHRRLLRVEDESDA